MSYNRPAQLPRRGTRFSPPPGWAPGQTTRRAPQKPLPLARRYELMWLDAEGLLQERTEIAPATPKFEAVASAFTHGVLIQTEAGEVPIEDLVPGMMLSCANGGSVELVWKSAITLVPGAPTSDDTPTHLYRVTADSFGPGRPSRDLVLGPAARRLVRDPAARQEAGTEAALARVSAAVDGTCVIEVAPARATRVYHLMGRSHATILANGLEVETFHPGANPFSDLSPDMRKMYMSLFPMLSPSDSFGRMLWPHLAGETQVPA